MELLESKIIKIGDKDYRIKMTIRSLINYEKITGHSVSQIDTLEDMIAFFYCVFKAGGNDISYEAFIDLIDDKPESLTDFTQSMNMEKKMAI